MKKRELILNAMQELFHEGTAGTASVSDIAKKAGIAKGGLYYYFRSKEEVLDALIDREYAGIREQCQKVIAEHKLPATQKFALLLFTYKTAYVDPSLDEYLHMPQNAGMHQKSLAQIETALAPLIRDILIQGVEEGSYECEYPQEYAEIILSVFTFLLDPGIFVWTPMQLYTKMKALADLLEKGLKAESGSFAFLYDSTHERQAEEQ